MKTFIYILAFLFVKQIDGQILDTKKLFKVCVDNVVLIATPEGTGSGFLINSDGYIITNHHVIEGFEKKPTQIKIFFRDDKEQFSVSTKSILCDEVIDYSDSKFGNDLALLKIKPIAKRGLPFQASNDLDMGASVAAIGNPGNISKFSAFNISDGKINNLKLLKKNADYLFEFDAKVNPGNSGGPILNENGQVVGIVVSKTVVENVERENFGIKLAYIKKLLEKNKVVYKTDSLIASKDLKMESSLTEFERLQLQQERKVEQITASKQEELKKLQDDYQLKIKKLEGELVNLLVASGTIALLSILLIFLILKKETTKELFTWKLKLLSMIIIVLILSLIMLYLLVVEPLTYKYFHQLLG